MNLKKMIKDTGLNTIGFAIYIIAQQLILLPIISKFTNDEIYSNFVIYLSILNIIANSTGGDVGNTRIVLSLHAKSKWIVQPKMINDHGRENEIFRR